MKGILGLVDLKFLIKYGHLIGPDEIGLITNFSDWSTLYYVLRLVDTLLRFLAIPACTGFKNCSIGWSGHALQLHKTPNAKKSYQLKSMARHTIGYFLIWN